MALGERVVYINSLAAQPKVNTSSLLSSWSPVATP